MAFYITPSDSDLIQILVNDSYANWSYEGAKALIDYFNDFEGQEELMQFDSVALRCDFSEYKTIEEILENYDSIESLKELEDNTIVIPFKGGYIIQDF
jgi:hypothetical protein